MDNVYLTQTKRQRIEMLFAAMKSEMSSFRSHWQDCNDYIQPRRARFTWTDRNKGERRTKNIIDSTATFASRTTSSGMQSGLTNPARPWFRLTTVDPSLSKDAAIMDWLHETTQRLEVMFLRSNLYQSLPTYYLDLAVFGTAAMGVFEHDTQVIRCFPFALGSYMLANNADLEPVVFMREFAMTVRQIVEQFGTPLTPDGKPTFDNISLSTKNLWDQGQFETWINVVHAVMPNPDYNGVNLTAKYKKFASYYFERGNTASGSTPNPNPVDGKFLQESGFDENPIMVSRWETTGEDVYGTNCPGMTALGDIKELQHGEKKMAQAIDKIVTPPMTGPTALRTGRPSLLPGDITYLDVRDGQQGFKASITVDPRVVMLEEKQQKIRDRINEAFFKDLFLMMTSSDRREITATEVEERHDEKLIGIGPVVTSVNQMLDNLIKRSLGIMFRRGQLPIPPAKLQGSQLRVEYISVLAQAQKMVGLSSLERFAGFAVQVGTVSPDALDRVDTDELIDEYADMTGVPPRVLRTDDQVAAIRAQRAQAAQAQQSAQTMKDASTGAKNLSNTDTQSPNALTDLMRGALASSPGGLSA